MQRGTRVPVGTASLGTPPTRTGEGLSGADDGLTQAQRPQDRGHTPHHGDVKPVLNARSAHRHGL